MDSSLPHMIGKYHILGELGKGAMGIVYEGYDSDIQRRVAIKTIRSNLIDSDVRQEFYDRFRREAQAAARCHHPNIVMILEYGDYRGNPFMVMEYVEGESFSHVLHRNPKIGLKQTLSIISQILRALHTAHTNGIAHRDIKPGNILLLKDGSIKLTDFGIARIQAVNELTRTGAVIGSPRYMAPEQTFGQPTDHRADLFALSVIFAELLYRMAPVAESIKLRPLPDQNLPPNIQLDYKKPIPEVFIPILTHGLAMRRDQRIKSAARYVQELKKVIPVLKGKMGRHPSIKPQIRKTTDLHGAETVLQNPLATGTGTAALTGNSSLSTGISSGTSSLETGQTTLVSALNEEELKRLEVDFRQHLGPMAARLIKHHAGSAISMAELIHSLAAEIPSNKEREQFILEWTD